MSIPRPYRVLIAAVAISAAVHAAFVAGVGDLFATDLAPPRQAAAYVATLVPPPQNPDDLPRPKPKAPPAPKPAPHRHTMLARSHAPRPHPHVATPPPREPILAQAGDPIFLPIAFQPVPDPQPLAALDPVSPLPETAAELGTVAGESFPADALPDDIEIDYALTSAVLEAHANYRWQREGDRYRITGEGSADGFFSLFLGGRMEQESEGMVTHDGLKPVRFIEKKPDTQDEGLEFDWGAHQVTYEWGESHRKTARLADNSVDWLSMIFQLAHMPPSTEARDMKISVLTQRKQYHFDLQVLGEEEIVIPLGHLRTLHLRHVDAENPKEVVDVWLGMDQHYLPVKLRYPVAHNRLVVEQTATKLSSR
jgi:hypothetical protein